MDVEMKKAYKRQLNELGKRLDWLQVRLSLEPRISVEKELRKEVAEISRKVQAIHGAISDAEKGVPVQAKPVRKVIKKPVPTVPKQEETKARPVHEDTNVFDIDRYASGLFAI